MNSIWKEKSGASGIEFALIAPVILLLLLGSLTVFDLYRSYSNVVQANYIVADIVTRETSINGAYVDRIYGAYGALVSSSGKPTALRISSLFRNKDGYQVQWTVERGDKTLIPQQQVVEQGNIPDIAELDSVIHVEGFQRQTTLSEIFGIDTLTFSPDAYVRPRFISAIAMSN